MNKHFALQIYSFNGLVSLVQYANYIDDISRMKCAIDL